MAEPAKCPICFNDLEGVSGISGYSGAQYSNDPILTPKHFIPELRGNTIIRARHIKEIQYYINECEVGPRSGISGYAGETDYVGVSGATQWSNLQSKGIVRYRHVNECREAIEKFVGYSGYAWVEGVSGTSGYEPVEGYSGTELRDYLSQDKDGTPVEPYMLDWLDGHRLGEVMVSERVPSKNEIGYDPFNIPVPFKKKEIRRGMHIEQIRKKLDDYLLEKFWVTLPEEYLNEAYVPYNPDPLQNCDIKAPSAGIYKLFTLPDNDTKKKNWACSWTPDTADCHASPYEGVLNPGYPVGNPGYVMTYFNEGMTPSPYMIRTKTVRFPVTNTPMYDPDTGELLSWNSVCIMTGLPQWGVGSPYRITYAASAQYPEEGNLIGKEHTSNYGFISSGQVTRLQYTIGPFYWYFRPTNYRTQNSGYPYYQWVPKEPYPPFQWILPTHLDVTYQYKVSFIPLSYSVAGNILVQVEQREEEVEEEMITVHDFNIKTAANLSSRGWEGTQCVADNYFTFMFYQLSGAYDYQINSKLKLSLNLPAIYTPAQKVPPASPYVIIEYNFYLTFYSVERNTYRRIYLYLSVEQELQFQNEFFYWDHDAHPAVYHDLPYPDLTEDIYLDLAGMYKVLFPEGMNKDEEFIYLGIDIWNRAIDMPEDVVEGYAYSSLTTTFEIKLNKIKIGPVKKRPGVVAHPKEHWMLP